MNSYLLNNLSIMNLPGKGFKGKTQLFFEKAAVFPLEQQETEEQGLHSPAALRLPIRGLPPCGDRTCK